LLERVTFRCRGPAIFVPSTYYLYTFFIHQRTGSKNKEKKHRKQAQINLTDMQLYPNLTAQQGLKVIKKINIDSITQLTYSFNISSILLENVM